jgi:hypothetical protein
MFIQRNEYSSLADSQTEYLPIIGAGLARF